MTNTNCLEGMACPECKQDAMFFVEAQCVMRLTDDGTEPSGDTEWNEESRCSCSNDECEFSGTVRDFQLDPGPLPRKSFSVLLRYSDYLNNGGNETFYTHVEAADSIKAIRLAQAEAAKHNEFEDDDNPLDFAPLLCIAGHHNGLATE